MTAVITTSMTLRIILSVRGSLVYGGTFSTTGNASSSSRTTHVISTRSGDAPDLTSRAHAYTLDDMRSKPDADWSEPSMNDGKGILSRTDTDEEQQGVRVTVDTQSGYGSYHAK